LSTVNFFRAPKLLLNILQENIESNDKLQSDSI